LSGTVTLDAAGDSNSVWIFQSNGPPVGKVQPMLTVVLIETEPANLIAWLG